MQTNDTTIKLESMREIPIGQIVELYKNGYIIEGISQASPAISTAQDGITISGDAILLIGIGILGYMYIKKHPEKL